MVNAGGLVGDRYGVTACEEAEEKLWASPLEIPGIFQRDERVVTRLDSRETEAAIGVGLVMAEPVGMAAQVDGHKQNEHTGLSATEV